MIVGLKRAMMFARGWKGRTSGLREHEMELHRGDRVVPATLLRPAGGPRPSPAWLVLHGITRPGRRHPTLVRFVRSVAASGAAVLVPEIPEWRDLYLAPDEAARTIRTSLLLLEDLPGIQPDRIGVMGFSLGVPQVLKAATDPSVSALMRAVAGFGGYGDLERTVRFLFQGEHEWGGVHHRTDPDPYGRWVLGGNYLTSIPGFEDGKDVAEALLALARKAGDLRVNAWAATYDGTKEELCRGIHPDRRDLFRLFAPATGQSPPPEASNRMASLLAQAARDATSSADPGSFVDRIPIPVRLVHGRNDRLIPYSESLRLGAAFPRGADVRVHITGLFSHSQADAGSRSEGPVKEQLRFLRILADLLTLV